MDPAYLADERAEQFRTVKIFLALALRPSDVQDPTTGRHYDNLFRRHQRRKQISVTLFFFLTATLLLVLPFLAPDRSARIAMIAIAIVVEFAIVRYLGGVIRILAEDERAALQHRFDEDRQNYATSLAEPVLDLSYEALQDVKVFLQLFRVSHSSLSAFRREVWMLVEVTRPLQTLAFVGVVHQWIVSLSDAALLERWPAITPPDIVIWN